MPNNQDPRNIFINQRQQYSESQAEKEKTSDETTKTTHERTTLNQSDYESKVEEMKRLAAKYEREGEGQLVRDIVSNVIEQKARGNLTNDQLEMFAKRISPLLNVEQRERLNGLVAELKKL